MATGPCRAHREHRAGPVWTGRGRNEPQIQTCPSLQARLQGLFHVKQKCGTEDLQPGFIATPAGERERAAA